MRTLSFSRRNGGGRRDLWNDDEAVPAIDTEDTELANAKPLPRRGLWDEDDGGTGDSRAGIMTRAASFGRARRKGKGRDMGGSTHNKPESREENDSGSEKGDNDPSIEGGRRPNRRGLWDEEDTDSGCADKSSSSNAAWQGSSKLSSLDGIKEILEKGREGILERASSFGRRPKGSSRQGAEGQEGVERQRDLWDDAERKGGYEVEKGGSKKGGVDEGGGRRLARIPSFRRKKANQNPQPNLLYSASTVPHSHREPPRPLLRPATPLVL